MTIVLCYSWYRQRQRDNEIARENNRRGSENDEYYFSTFGFSIEKISQNNDNSTNLEKDDEKQDREIDENNVKEAYHDLKNENKEKLLLKIIWEIILCVYDVMNDFWRSMMKI